MSAALLEPAEHALAALRRARAGGERFVGALLPGATARRMQAAAVVDEWAAANLDARHDAGPLWVVLGDGASLGLGASTRDAGYVRLRRRGAGGGGRQRRGGSRTSPATAPTSTTWSPGSCPSSRS